jgi:hypothetical protein
VLQPSSVRFIQKVFFDSLRLQLGHCRTNLYRSRQSYYLRTALEFRAFSYPSSVH